MKKISKLIIVTVLIMFLLISGCIEENNETKNAYDNLSTEGLIGFWMFNENQPWDDQQYSILDISVNANNGKAHGCSKENKGTNGNFFAYFDGKDDYILINNSPSLEPQKISIELWAKAFLQNGSFSYLIAKGGNACDWASYGVYTDSNNGICFYIHDGSQILKSPNPGQSIWDNQWHHIVGTFDNSKIRLYIDGEEISDGNQANSTIRYNLSHNNNLILGNYIGSCTLPFSGSIDNVLLWNRTLSSEEIYQHYLFGSQESISSDGEPDSVSFDTAKSRIKTFLEPYTVDNILIIKGSKLSIQDNLILTMVSSQIDNAHEITKITDNENSETSLDNYDLIILLGSEKTNSYTSQIRLNHQYDESTSFKSTPFIIHFGKDNQQDKEILIAYLVTEPNNQVNYGAEKSPLNGLIDKKIIPVIVTSTSILLIYLWSIFGNTLSEFIFDFISEHIAERKMKKLKKDKNKSKDNDDRNKILKELLATLLAIIVFSLAMSWTWSADMNEFQRLLIVNIFIITTIYILREGIRMHLSKKYEMDTKHVFWPFGAILTLASTILGNTFSLASFTMLENDEQQKKFGKMYYFIFKFFYLLGLLFFIGNFFYPTIYFQMFYVFIMMSIVIDMTPFEPMDGYDVRFWNKRKWLAFYIIVILSYIIMNFSLMIQI